MTTLTMNSPAASIDHTLLAPTATEGQVRVLCEEAVEYGFAAVCVPPSFVALSAAALYGSGVKVCSVVGFPCGYATTRSKVRETAGLVAAGAAEIDMVIAVGRLLEESDRDVEDEIAQVVIAAERCPVKAIIECCYLNVEQKRRAAELAVRGGADYVKTSTGFGPSGALIDDVALLADVVAGRAGIKAAGGIRTLDACQDFIAAGATRIGTSSGVAIMREWHKRLLER